MMTPAKNVKFENRTDVINYVTNGLPPRQKDYQAARIWLVNSETGDEIALDQNKILAEALDIIYDNIKKEHKRMTVAAVVGIGIASVLGISVGMSKGREKGYKDGYNDGYYSRLDDRK